MIWRVVPDDRRRESGQLVEAWGYFRSVTDLEIEGSTWFALVSPPDTIVGLLWFTAGPDLGSLSAHACTDPAHRGRLSCPDTMRGVEIIAGLLGAECVYSVLEGADGVNVASVRRWLRLRGWQPHELGMRKELA